MEKISVIIPCYNEEDALPLFYKEASKVLDQMRNDYEFIFVNDGSTDETLPVLKGLAENDHHVTLIIPIYLVQVSCEIRTAVPVSSGQWFSYHPDRMPVPSRQDDIYSC